MGNSCFTKSLEFDVAHKLEIQNMYLKCNPPWPTFLSKHFKPANLNLNVGEGGKVRVREGRKEGR